MLPIAANSGTFGQAGRPGRLDNAFGQARLCPQSAPGQPVNTAAPQVRAAGTGEPACRPGSVHPRKRGPAAIHLGLPLPAASCGLPASIGRAALNRSRRKRARKPAPLLTLLPVGFTEPPQSPAALVVSYTTVSPLPPYGAGRWPAPGEAVCFLWHCPAGRPGSVLPTTVPCGARTFLAAHRAARPPGRLARLSQDIPSPRPSQRTPCLSPFPCSSESRSCHTGSRLLSGYR